MFCEKCGSKNNINNKYCIECGYKFNKGNNNLKRENNEKNSLILGIICFVSSFFINVFCFIPGIISIIYAKKNKKETGRWGIGFGLSISGIVISLLILTMIILFFIFAFSYGINNIDNFNDTITEYNYNIDKV